jgi:hypothetical protein
MNETLSTVLREHADGDVHIERLLGAVHAGVRRRRQRRLAVVCGAAVLVTASVTVTAAAPGPDLGTVVSAPPLDAHPRPPQVVNSPAAITRPEVLGSDPSLFHLDLTGLAGLNGWVNLAWSSRAGYEDLTVSLGPYSFVQVAAARDKENLAQPTVATWEVMMGGQPVEAISTGRSFAVRWEPRPGIWAQVEATDSIQQAIDVAEQVRLDRVFRCAVPFRLTGLAEARLRKCDTDFRADGLRPWAQAWLTLGPGDTEYQVAVSSVDDGSVVPNDTVAGRPVEFTAASDGTPLTFRFAYDGRIAYFWAFSKEPDVAPLRSLVAAFVPVAGDDPAVWPSSPLVR